jgi:hypothetical protein
MSESQGNQQAGGERVMYERCLCREALDHLRDCLGVSPAVREHFTNSRIEFLKAIRAVIDERIEHISNVGERGTKVPVE